MNTKQIFSHVLARALPKKRNEKIVHGVVSALNKALSKKNVDAHASIGGSVAKGTHLSYHDCDVFVIFTAKYNDKDISQILADVLPFRCKRVHGSRDYFQMEQAGILFEFIPVITIQKASDASNVTDLSPLHVVWVNQHIGKLRNDVRLAKIFCKAQGVYGAESHIKGFSGYLLELLVIAYGGFLPFLKAGAIFAQKQVIDINHIYKDRQELFEKVNASKLQSPLIVIDPVQADRNAAAAISEEIFARFVLAAKLFLQHSSLAFFQEPRFSLTTLKKRAKSMGASLLLFTVIPHEGKEDVSGGKIVKVFDFLMKMLQQAEFHILSRGWHWNEKAYLWYIAYPDILPDVFRQQGPLVYSLSHHITAFLKKHKSFIVENNRIIALRKRKQRSLHAYAKQLTRDPYITEKVKKIAIL